LSSLPACSVAETLIPKRSFECSIRSPDSKLQLRERKGRGDTKKSRIQGEQILSSKDAFFEAEYCAKLGLNSAPRIPKGLVGSNLPLSAIKASNAEIFCNKLN
jgi:hypothetical protein